MSDEKIPDKLLCQIQWGNCIPFIGAGVSMEAEVGLPSGGDLALTLVAEIEKIDPEKKYRFKDHQNDTLAVVQK